MPRARLVRAMASVLCSLIAGALVISCKGGSGSNGPAPVTASPAVTDLALEGNTLVLRNVSAYFTLQTTDRYITCTGDSLVLGAWDIGKAPRSEIVNDTVSFDLADLPSKDHRLNLLIYDPSVATNLPGARWLNTDTTLKGNPLVRVNGDGTGKAILGVRARLDQGVTVLESVPTPTVAYSPDPPRPQDLRLDGGALVIEHVSWHFRAPVVDATTEILVLGDFNSWEPSTGLRSPVSADRYRIDLGQLSFKSHRLGALIYSPTLTKSNMATEGKWLALESFGDTPLTPTNGNDPPLGRTLAVQVVKRGGERLVEPFPNPTIYFTPEIAAPNDLTFTGRQAKLTNPSNHINCVPSDTLVMVGDFCDWDPSRGVRSTITNNEATFDLSSLPVNDHRVGVVVDTAGLNRGNLSSARWLDTASLGDNTAIDANGNDPAGRDLLAVTVSSTNVQPTQAPVVYFSAASAPVVVVPLEKQVSGVVYGASGPPAAILQAFQQRAQTLGIQANRKRSGVYDWRGAGGQGGYMQTFAAQTGTSIPDSFALMKADSSSDVLYVGGAIWTVFRERHQDRWDARSYDDSPCGYPTGTEQTATSQQTGRQYVFATFAKNAIIVHHTSAVFDGRRTFIVFGPILDYWRALGASACPIGVPAGDVTEVAKPVAWPGHQQCVFETGRIVYLGSEWETQLLHTLPNRQVPGAVAYRYPDRTLGAEDDRAFADRFVFAAIQFVGAPTVLDPGAEGGTGVEKDGIDCSGLLQAGLRDASGKRLLLPPYPLSGILGTRELARTTAEGLADNFFSRLNRSHQFEYTYPSPGLPSTGQLLFWNNQPPAHYSHSGIRLIDSSGTSAILYSSGYERSKGRRVQIVREDLLLVDPPTGFGSIDATRTWSFKARN